MYSNFVYGITSLGADVVVLGNDDEPSKESAESVFDELLLAELSDLLESLPISNNDETKFSVRMSLTISVELSLDELVDFLDGYFFLAAGLPVKRGLDGDNTPSEGFFTIALEMLSDDELMGLVGILEPTLEPPLLVALTIFPNIEPIAAI